MLSNNYLCLHQPHNVNKVGKGGNHVDGTVMLSLKLSGLSIRRSVPANIFHIQVFTMTNSCAALDTPHTQWSFCPNVGAAYFFAILFALTTVTHLVQAIYHRKIYCWVIVASGIAQTLAYIFRIRSIQNPASFENYAAWFILILIAPLFTNAFAYMVMGRMVWNYTTEAKIWKISAWRFGLYFVILDIVAFLVQIFGAASASSDDASTDEVLQARSLLYALYAVIVLITASHLHPACCVCYLSWLSSQIRIVFRLAEYSQGLTSSIPNHEAFQYALDSVPMFFALILLNVLHPGRIMTDPESDIPGRRERKGEAFKTKNAEGGRWWKCERLLKPGADGSHVTSGNTTIRRGLRLIQELWDGSDCDNVQIEVGISSS
ncbi:hypothetical protein EYC84_006832 [Monilinia fructicola]|uniref:RTA1 domain protein n=1 Tax=Monilinia fructicola TaxID=38448 RepID=A0A5M9K8G2_MONFR|nr:hypothetical protein EYC84_006832 [Monilinia fructicola]